MPPKKKTSTRSKSSSRSGKNKGSVSRRSNSLPIQTGISPERKLEIIGVLLILVAILTLIGMVRGGPLGTTWVYSLNNLLGWGVYLMPALLLLLGVWILIQRFTHVPQITLERMIGLFFSLFAALVFLHLLLSPASKEEAYALAEVGKGGGYIGAWLLWLLKSRLGTLGTLIALFALLLISLAMALDISVVELFRWVKPLVLRIQDTWDERRAFQNAPQLPLLDHTSSTERNRRSRLPEQPQSLPEEIIKPAPVKRNRVRAQAAPPQPVTPPTIHDWELPALSEMLDEGATVNYSEDYDQQRARVIEETLSSFGAPAHVVEINRGPTITQFGVEPDFIESRSGRTRVRVGKIAALSDDLSLALAASRIRIQAPVPGKGYIGIEVPNEKVAVVALRDVLESKAFTRLRSPLSFALGQDVAGNAVAADLTGMPHLLVAGATGSGKSVFVNSLICAFLLHNTPAILRLIMVDPKRVELTGYNGVPHLMSPVVTEIQRVVGVLQWVTREMDGRYQKFADIGARNIADYNNQMSSQNGELLPYLVVVIDELADLMMIAPDQTERVITRLAQLARATGIHLVISTQRPSVDVVTGLIKANFPARISFAVASGVDSRVVLDQPGAERLLGRGDMLFQAPDAAAPARLQGVYVSDSEILRIVQYWRSYAGTADMAPVATSTAVDSLPNGVPLKQMPIWEEMEEQEEQDSMYPEAVSLVRRKGRASISMLQRRLRIGYTRAARMVDQMEADGIIGPATGSSTPREVLDYGQSGTSVDEE